MLALRAGGTQLGWGFQLQSPAFVTLLAALFFVLALNLFGVFEWGGFAQSMTSNVSAQRPLRRCLPRGRARHAWSRRRAPRRSWAPPWASRSRSRPPSRSRCSRCWALGMALPVLALSLFPGALRRLPRPGAWMETFKQVMAFPLFATVAWLAWVLGAQAGNDAVLGAAGRAAR